MLTEQQGTDDRTGPTTVDDSTPKPTGIDINGPRKRPCCITATPFNNRPFLEGTNWVIGPLIVVSGSNDGRIRFHVYFRNNIAERVSLHVAPPPT
ncbi:hypothetical protein M3J09_002794 [Ascochyta lentis]